MMLTPGDSFGDYKVIRLLGKGGMGSVFLLENAEGGQVAAKILDPATAGDHESRKRFLREAQLALGVKHPNLVETYDVGEDPDTGLCYILMEYVPGGSLADKLRNGPLPVNEAIRIVYQIASVLELARQKGVVHRDIKPDNIMFGADGKAKLADLGIARGGVGDVGVTTVTQTGMMIGTPAYMAPEQMLDAHNVDSRADIYSLGIVFYEMLAGKRPNADDTVVQLMAKAVAGEPIPDVRTMRPEISAAVAELISLMCAIKADERIATPVEVTTALSQIVHGREVTIRRKRPSAQAASRGRSRAVSARMVLAGAFGIAAVAGIAAFVYFGLQRTSDKVSGSTPVRNQVEPTIVPLPPSANAVPEVPVRRTEKSSVPPSRLPDPQERKPAEKPLDWGVHETGVVPRQLDLGEGRSMAFVGCPAGTFTMGCVEPEMTKRMSGNFTAQAHVKRKVTITRPFWIGKFPVTLGDFERIYPELLRWRKPSAMQRAVDGPDVAIGNISAKVAREFCERMTRKCRDALPEGYVVRLPTWAELEYALRSGGTYDDVDPYGRKDTFGAIRCEIGAGIEGRNRELAKSGLSIPEDRWSYVGMHPTVTVGRYKPNRWGIHDFYGNVEHRVFDSVPARVLAENFDPSNPGTVPVGDVLSGAGERDPFVWCPDEDAAGIMISGASGRIMWRFATVKACAPDQCHATTGFRVVIGPDLGMKRADARPSRPRKPPLTFDLGEGERLEFVSCPAGMFMMGLPGERLEPNASLHQVEISRPYWISRYQLTWRQWMSLTGETHAFSKVEKFLGGDRCPVTNRGRAEVDALCAQLTRRFDGNIPAGYVFRLPTCAEWEYAVRSGDEREDDDYGRFRRGDWLAFDNIAWGRTAAYKKLRQAGFETFSDLETFRDAYDRRMTHGTLTAQEERWLGEALCPAAVGRMAPNHWGIYDMFGNGNETLLDLVDFRFGQRSILMNLSKEGRERDPLLTCKASNARHVMANDIGGIRFLDEDGPRQTIRLVVGPMDFNGGKTRLGMPVENQREQGRAERPADAVSERKIAALSGKSFKLPRNQVLELVGCPAGRFTMGNPRAPQAWTVAAAHEVRLTRPFWIGKHPVTREQWSSLMNKVEPDGFERALGGPKAPVTKLSRGETMELCEQLTRRFRAKLPKGYVFRLPTDAEWEYALRGGSSDPDDPHVMESAPPELRSRVAILREDKLQRLRQAGLGNRPNPPDPNFLSFEVCTKRPNAWGIYDMLGNVDEWLLDTFPIEGPDGSIRKTGQGAADACTYAAEETDPFRRYDKSDGIGMVRAIGDSSPSGYRRFVLPSARVGAVGFRVVLGPDLEKEQRDAARATKRRK